VTSPYAQSGFRVRFDWGLAGAVAVGNGAVVVAVVDVLSFTTTLTVAADRGVEVFPYRFRDDTAVAFAERHDAVLAVGRSTAGPDEVSLSPASVRAAAELRRLVLPSPNGSAISQRVAAAGTVVVGVALRNAGIAAEWVAARLAADPEAAVAVIAAGEHWPDGSLRPAVEDLWGAGALLAGLVAAGEVSLSPEAMTAAGAYRDVRHRLPQLLWDCASGRELRDNGFPQDVRIAAEVDASSSVPVLVGNRFVPELAQVAAADPPDRLEG
jgi:2-phosphosulfolactate phosphatase